jgi:hypothetical protein
MQEFDFSVSDAFRNGRSPDDEVGRNFGRQFLSEIFAMRPTPSGLRPTLSLANPFGSDQFSSWPFPQIANEQQNVLLLGATAFNVVDDSADPWSVGAALTLLDYDDPGQAATITSGGPWHWTEFQHSCIYTNGQSIVVRDNSLPMLGQPQQTLVSGTNVNSVCFLEKEGRVFYGGFSPSDLWGTEWSAVFEEYLNRSPVAIDYTDQQAIQEQFVFWSSIGGPDALWPLSPPEAEHWLDMFERNEAGFAPMPWRGTVYRVLPLGNGVIVYGDKGIARLVPVSTPFPTFGIQRIARFGIASRSAVYGTEQRHVLVASDGELWEVTADGIRDIGFRADLEQGIGQEFVVSFDPLEAEFHIAGQDSGGDTFNYVLTGAGLGQHNVVPTHIVQCETDIYAVTDSVSGSYRLATTEVFDFNMRDVKTITTVEVGGHLSADDLVEVAVDYRYDNDAAFTRSNWVPVNQSGFARPQITANEFRVALRCPIDSDLELDYVNIRWQSGGRRTVRGITNAGENVS